MLAAGIDEVLSMANRQRFHSQVGPSIVLTRFHTTRDSITQAITLQSDDGSAPRKPIFVDRRKVKGESSQFSTADGIVRTNQALQGQ